MRFFVLYKLKFPFDPMVSLITNHRLARSSGASIQTMSHWLRFLAKSAWETGVCADHHIRGLNQTSSRPSAPLSISHETLQHTTITHIKTHDKRILL